MTRNILEVEHLHKEFGGIVAVDDATFSVEEGSIAGLIGPNGAGKTTTFNLISGFYRPDGGVVRYEGEDIQQLMNAPSTERGFKLIGAGTSLGLAGLGAASIAGFPPLFASGFGTVGALAGMGIYHQKERRERQSGNHSKMRPFRLAEQGLARTFQITRELQGMTVLENMLLSAPNQGGERLFTTVFRSGTVQQQEEEIREEAHELLELLEIENLADEYAGNLSGGQRKLLELGRILMLDPNILLLDEPVAGVNPRLTDKLLENIKKLRKEGYTFLIVEHDMDVIMNLSDEIIVMSEGKDLVTGTPEEIQNDQRVIDAYLGEGL